MQRIMLRKAAGRASILFGEESASPIARVVPMTFFILMFLVVYISPVFFCAGLEAFAIVGSERSTVESQMNGLAGMNMASRKHPHLGSTIVADA